ncbi:probable histone-lysine N-methyltransferase CG1716 [Orussus abietinus]|uniref:probable histone-lysine N-methyltransferase CG1716 n=1 Tax=Orussus abietinus TaxID=222816 RepID=UPI000625C9AB|nr:probable histone-lysine N-methyltransferase CG1716 [Orussus abietinus]XP_012274644.1 probable histone-lysine N-methyltransferase CG1716 [Orussus abietinus]
MARRRKNESKSTVKSPLKFVAVRKSSRQIAKKQLEDKKVNGGYVRKIHSNDSEESRSSQESREQAKKGSSVHKKFGKYSRSSNNDRESSNDEITNESDSIAQYKQDAGESDSQDGLDTSILPSEKLSPEDVRQVVVGISNPSTQTSNESTSNEVMWQEDVIEETIICEEMEVEGDAVDNGYVARDDNVVLEEVLLVKEPDFDEKGVVEFTVIQNDDGTESMVMSSDSRNVQIEDCYQDTSGFRLIEEGVSSLHMSESVHFSSASVIDDICVQPESEEINKSQDFDIKSECKKDAVPNRKKCAYVQKDRSKSETRSSSKKSSRSSVPCLPEEGSSRSSVCNDKSDSNTAKSSSEQESLLFQDESTMDKNVFDETTKCSLKESSEIIHLDDNLAGMQISESQKGTTDSNSPNVQKHKRYMKQSSTYVPSEKVLPPIQETESDLALLDKLEHLHTKHSSDDGPPEETEISDGHILINSMAEQTSILKIDDLESKIACTNSFISNPKLGQEKPSADQLKNSERVQNIEELSGDSEMDAKADSEDIKMCSSSENSNDTLLSANNCKMRDFGDKSNTGSLSEGDKKPGFRSRSGSTDTTGSESGSNSSGVRRSSRIRSIGLMKQRSRGRGLVVKPSTEVTKTTPQQERDKLSSISNVIGQELKDNVDNQLETQSDKENSSNKTIPTTNESLTPLLNVIGATGYDSDSTRPVKVKSRWRRSSELEMGSGSLSNSRTGTIPVLNYGSTINQDTLSSSGPKTESGFMSPLAVSSTSVSTSGNGSACISTLKVLPTNIEKPVEKDSRCETPIVVENASAVLPSQVVIGSKIPLPMVLQIKDREMEERLSQFEHLRENLYLTERYTNKETKRMVCDCFLTEDEISRGELGCGEDCLNRLLMIECGSRCVVGDRCTNKRFQNCEYAKCEVFRTEKKGFGLRATVDLFAGEFIMEYVGEVVDPKDFRRRAKEYSKDKNRHYYFMALKSDQIIDATMKGNVSRFINHSCDPNSETQKWTVNGELRIGFFNKKFIAAGEEITFDYHFQRYGKEAQKCFCEATNCRGWIGETPEEEKEKIEKKEKGDKDKDRKKKEEKKPADYMEDEDLEEEIDKLCSGGLKNRAHTLTLSRLMVRSRELEHRTRLLRLVQSGEQPCRRLFLDYHGLRLIWSYMMDVMSNKSEEAQQFRLEILKTLGTLPIPNKTMLMDSKVFSVVDKWAKRLYALPSGDSPEDDLTKSKGDDSSCDSNEKPNIELSEMGASQEKETDSSPILSEIKQEAVEQTLVPELASNLLVEWSNLKEVFRIPKKERIEQMKEHEREADRGYREVLEKEERRETSYERHRADRYGRNETDKRVDRRRGRDSPDFEYNKTKDKRTEERGNLVPIPRMSKYERRQLFALKVAKEEEERQRRQQEESWQEHEARCMALGMDPHTTATVDPQTGYPLFFNPSLGQWQPYPIQDGGEIAQQCTPVYVGGHSQTLPGLPQSTVSQTPAVLTAAITPGIQPVIPAGVPPTVYMNQTPAFTPPNTAYPILPHPYPESQIQISGNLLRVHTESSPVPIPTQPLYIEKSVEQFTAPVTTAEPASFTPVVSASTPAPEPPPLDLPPKWKWAKDARGRIYYYHVKERISQWLPPPPDHIGVHPDSSSTSESSDETSSSNEDDEDVDDDRNSDKMGDSVLVENSLVEGTSRNVKESTAKKLDIYAATLTVGTELKRRRDGLVQERIISPRREDDRIDHKKYKEIKEKLRRQKERAKLKEQVEKLRKHRRSSKSKSYSRHSSSKLQAIATDPTSTSERKIKDTFRINMANVMVHFLNPYRKSDCKQGRITNTDDFKHLARKLTHFVLAKELKHCKSVDELQCNDNVKHKAKDFVRKYMSKFGAVYQKATDED